ncbi:MAG: hypothetical protein L7S71_06620, partial [Pseudomonadales bacterium]|nr:hypothetical protein [Pseudomonadales bacterium]
MTPSIGSLVVRYRFALTILSLIMAGAMAWGMQFSTFDGTTDSILSEGDPYKAEVDQARIDFPPSTSMLVAFEVPGDIFTFKTLRAIEELTQRYIEVDSALAVSSILNYRLNESDKQTYGRTYLIPELDTLSEADLVQIKEIALADEDLVESLLSPQGDFTIASIKFKVSEDTAEKRLAVAESAVAL